MYFLFNKDTKVQSNNLDLKAAVETLLQHPIAESWIVWREGLDGWQELVNFSELNAHLPPPIPKAEPKPAGPPPLPTFEESRFEIVELVESSPILVKIDPPHPEVVTSPEKEIAIVVSEEPIAIVSSVESKPENPADRRKHPRIHGRLRTIIKVDKKAFMTYTKDISIAGMQLEDQLPAELAGKDLDIFITSPDKKSSISFKCHPIQGQNDYFRFYFSGQSDQEVSALGNWLEKLKKNPNL